MSKRFVHCCLLRCTWYRCSLVLLTSLTLIMSTLAACGPSLEDLQAIEYAPLPGEDWPVSAPAAQGLDPMQVAELYYNAARLETIYGLLVVKDGYLVAEKYFNSSEYNPEVFMRKMGEELTAVMTIRVKIELMDPGSLPRTEGKAKRVIDMRKE